MSDNSFGYDIESVASNYCKYRPMWPPKLYEMILLYLDKGSEADEKRGVAVDAGCGSGQCTRELCRHFKTVIGIDTSEAQLNEAKKFCADHKNVELKLLAAEHMSSAFKEDSVDLIMAGMALHWFDIDAFFADSLRVLKPKGVLVAFSCQIPTLDNEQANDVFHHQIFRGIFERYWQPGAYLLFDYYNKPFSTLKLHYDETVRDDSLTIEYNFSVNEIFGMIKSFPQYYYFKTDHPEHPDDVDIGLEKLLDIYGIASRDQKLAKGSSQISLIMGRKPLDVSRIKQYETEESTTI